jgi:GntR family transcriptional regulator
VSVEWNDKLPIYKQLRELVVARILDGSFCECEAVPSVRQVSSEYQINHLTVAKAYQELVEEGILLKQRGRGMFVVEGARCLLSDNEQEQFLAEELPAFIDRVNMLGLDMNAVISKLQKTGDNK